MLIQRTVEDALRDSRLTEAEWAAEAGVDRKQAYELLRGGNLCRDTVRKLLEPLGLVCCVAEPAELAAAAELLASIDAFLARIEPPFGAAEPVLLYIGAPLAGLRSDQIAAARAGLAAARHYLLMLERTDDAGAP